jgi:hypothetical protein
MTRPAHVSVTRQLTATVRSEQILPNGPWFVPALMVAGFPVGGLGVVFAAGMVFATGASNDNARPGQSGIGVAPNNP